MESIVSLFGRGTAAGDALHRCYMKKQEMYSTVDPQRMAYYQRVREDREEEERNTIRPKVVSKSQTCVPRPRVGNAYRRPLTSPERALLRLNAVGGKRKIEMIQRTEDEVNQRLRAGQIPLNKSYESKFARPVISEEEKARLGEVFEYGMELKQLYAQEKWAANQGSRMGGANAATGAGCDDGAYTGSGVNVPLTGARRVEFFKMNEEAKLTYQFTSLQAKLMEVKGELEELRREHHRRGDAASERGAPPAEAAALSSHQAPLPPILNGRTGAAKAQAKALQQHRATERELMSQISDLLEAMRTTSDKLSELQCKPK